MPPLHLICTLSFSFSSSFIFFFPKTSEFPKYKEPGPKSLKPNKFFILPFKALSIFGEKKIVDFSGLTCYPAQAQNLSRTREIAFAFSIFALYIIIMSSTYNRCEIEGAPLLTLIPCKFPFSSSYMINLVRTSTHIINKSGEMGSLWRIPRAGVKLFVSLPFNSNLYVTMPTQLIKKFVTLSENPQANKVGCRKLHSR